MIKISFFSAPWKSGAGWFNRELAKAIASKGIEVTFISPLAEPESREISGPNLKRLVIPGGPSIQRGKIHKAKRAITKLCAALTFIRTQSQVSKIFVYSFYDWIWLCIAHFKFIKKLDGQLIYVVHDATPHASRFPKILRFFETYLLARSFQLPDRLVTLTQSAKAELVTKYAVNQDKIAVIPHGAFATDYSPVAGTGQIILFGSLRRNKRIKEVINAFVRHQSRFPNLSLLIAGEVHADDPKYWEECKAAIRESNANITTETGYIPDARLTELIAQSDAVILAYEDFTSQSGAAVLSCFSERIIIGTLAGGLAELAENGLSMVPIERPVTADSIADSLQAFYEIPISELKDRASKSREKMTHYLSWERIGALYVELIKDVLTCSPKNGAI